VRFECLVGLDVDVDVGEQPAALEGAGARAWALDLGERSLCHKCSSVL
jgi:hypothetical protein